jgi:hypothetical protein
MSPTSGHHDTKMTHARDHYSAAIEEPQRAVTFARPRRPLRARLRHLKRRARSARPLPLLWAFNGPVPYLVSVTLERAEPGAQKNRPSKGAITDQWTRDPLDESRCHRCPQSRGLLISSSRAGSTGRP